jgi:hypothetical protein
MICVLYDGAPESTSQMGSMTPYATDFPRFSNPPAVEYNLEDKNSSGHNSSGGSDQSRAPSTPPPPPSPPAATTTTARDVTRSTPPLGHQCENFAFPPPPPAGSKRIGPRRKFEVFFQILLVMYFFRNHMLSDIKISV